MADMSAVEAVGAVQFTEGVELEAGDIPEAAIVVVKYANVHHGRSGVARLVSEGLTYWEVIGILVDMLEDAKDEGRWDD